MPNRLKDEKSPYLLQHANNPVDWYPWSEEAFKAAREHNKLIFLSVGYSTCHWCHVMERESFEHQEIAEIMNRNFINIKVDREERPDVDRVYMTFVQASSGGGGWPMSVFMTPSLKPIFAGTYFPPEDNFGRSGFKTVLQAIASQWEKNPSSVISSGDKILEALEKAERSVVHDFPNVQEVSQKCFSQLLRGYDPEFGGFSSAPKFPQPVNLNFLFQLYSQDREADRSKQALKMCLHTLEMMSLGGINDHVSKGFARYSTDDRWHVPHFEKMLYDQGQLAVAYATAYKATKEEKFAITLEAILEYVNRDLRHPLGGFFSAEDADSKPTFDAMEKKEGAFCVWTFQQLSTLIPDQVLPEKDGKFKLLDLFCRVFDVKEGGNVNPRGDPHGELKSQNVLTKIVFKENDILEEFGLTRAKLEAYMENCREVLFQERLRRPRPHLDDKIISAWNGLMISGFCAASSALQKPEHLETAENCANFVMEHLYDADNKILLRSVYAKSKDEVCQIDTPIAGFADDYAFIIRAFLDLYEVNLNPIWIERAFELQNKMDELFWDAETGGYFSASKTDDNIVIKLKEDQDGAEPASNSVAAMNLIRLAAILDKPEFRTKSETIFKIFANRLEKIPMALPEMVSALMMHGLTTTQIIISGTLQDEKTKAMVSLVQKNLLSNKILILADSNFSSILYRNLKVLKDFPPEKVGNAYVCKNFTCSAPISSLEDFKKELKIEDL